MLFNVTARSKHGFTPCKSWYKFTKSPYFYFKEIIGREFGHILILRHETPFRSSTWNDSRVALRLYDLLKWPLVWMNSTWAVSGDKIFVQFSWKFNSFLWSYYADTGAHRKECDDTTVIAGAHQLLWPNAVQCDTSSSTFRRIKLSLYLGLKGQLKKHLHFPTSIDCSWPSKATHPHVNSRQIQI